MIGKRMSVLLEMHSKFFMFERTCFISLIFKWFGNKNSKIKKYQCLSPQEGVQIY